jgi:catecholate siderophore receptor
MQLRPTHKIRTPAFCGRVAVRFSLPLADFPTIRTMNPTSTRSRLTPLLQVLLLAGAISLAPLASAQAVRPATGTPAASDAAKAEALLLDVFNVAATRGQNYGASNMASATRMNTPIENVPQAINVVNANLLQDIGAYSFDQAMRYTPGVTQRQNSPDGAVIRGLASTFNHYQDGYFAPAVVTDMASIDRIEVIKGPSASIAGASESAGFLNFITKKPLFTDARSLSLTIGSWNFMRGVADVTGPLPGFSNVAYRVIGSYMNADTFRDNERIKKTAVFPSVHWKINRDLDLLVRVESVSNETPGGFGTAYFAPTFGATANLIPVPANAKVKLGQWMPLHVNSSGLPGMARKTTLGSVMTVLTYRLSDLLSFRQSGNYYTFSNDLYRNALADNFTYDSNGDLFGTYAINRSIAKQYAYRLQGDVALRWDPLGDTLTVRALAGYEVARTRGSSINYQSANSVIPINVAAPVFTTAPSDLRNTGNSNSKGGSFATFANAQIGLFKEFALFTGGIRFDENKAGWNRNNLNGGVSNTATTPTIRSPLVGLTIKPFKHVTIFGVYSNAGAAASNVSTFPNLPATDARQILVSVTPDTTNREFGAKLTFFNGNLSLGVSHFDTTQNNIVRNQTDPSFPGGSRNFIDSGNNSQGIEVSVAGDLNEKLSLYGGYLHNETSAPGRKPDGGQLELRGAPDDKLQLFARYLLRKNTRGAIALKGGVVYQTSVYGRASNTYVIPGATRYDVGVDYRNQQWSFSTGIINLTDEVFPTFAVGQGSNTIDDPRNFYFSVNYTF